MTLELIPFRVEVSDEEVADLRARLERTRWPDQIPGTTWEYGPDRGFLAEVCEHWRTAFDWRAFESRFNAFPNFTTTVRGHHLHLIHARSGEPSAVPVLLLHGWPGSVAEHLEVIGPLAAPGPDACHVVVPSLPGYGWSGPTVTRGVELVDVAESFLELMAGLGYDRFLVQGGDWGAIIGTQMAEMAPDRVLALHLNLIIGQPAPGADPMAGLDEEDQALVKAVAAFRRTGMGYHAIQRTRPQALAYALQDSPAGLAGWILDKFSAWSGVEDPRDAFPVERLLDNLTVYWLTGTIGSSMRLYREVADSGLGNRPDVRVPTAYADFPAEPFKTPRPWAEAHYDVRRWTSMARGGHFAAMEAPELLVEDVRAFLRTVRNDPGPATRG